MSGFVPLRPTLPPATDIHVSVGGVDHFPVESMSITSGSYGSVGHGQVDTSRALMDILSIDLVKVASSATVVPFLVYAETPTVRHTKIFDGDILSTEWDMDQDNIVVHARDHAGVFVDQKRILTRDAKTLTEALGPLSPGQNLTSSGISTVNRRVSQVVSDIATEFGYTPQIDMGDGTDVMAGAAYGGSDHTYMTIPQNLWSILNTLARDTGNEVYTTPDRKLVFGTPGAGLPTLRLSWNTTIQPGLTTEAIPCARLHIVHNPRRNGTFRVLVTSYDPTTAKITQGRATFIGSNLATSGHPEGIYSGAAANSADSQLLEDARTKKSGEAGNLGSARDLSHIQLYTFHWDGLTADDANARAAAIAADISKRLLLLRCTIDGLPTITPTQKLTVESPRLPPSFTGNTWYVSGFRHVFRLPRGRESRQWSGYTTEIQALDLPSVALAGTIR